MNNWWEMNYIILSRNISYIHVLIGGLHQRGVAGNKHSVGWHGDFVVNTLASQQEGLWFDYWATPMTCLCRICTFSLCVCEWFRQVFFPPSKNMHVLGWLEILNCSVWVRFWSWAPTDPATLLWYQAGKENEWRIEIYLRKCSILMLISSRLGMPRNQVVLENTFFFFFF